MAEVERTTDESRAMIKEHWLGHVKMHGYNPTNLRKSISHFEKRIREGYDPWAKKWGQMHIDVLNEIMNEHVT
jgi:hypothetical protein